MPTTLTSPGKLPAADAPASPDPYRVLVLAPIGRDASLINIALTQNSIASVPCQSATELCQYALEAAGALILTEEALTQAVMNQLRAVLERQPSWSDLPLIVLTGHGPWQAKWLTVEQLGVLGNTTVLERPMQRNILVRAVHVALRARARQYERRRAAQALETSLKEKEVLLKEVHHRVKNNLQVITSLLGLQSRSVQDKAALEALEESQRRIQSMALVHESLYRASDLSRVDMQAYLRGLLDHFMRAAPGHEISLNASRASFSIDLAVPCGLILNELISNAMKHAFPAGRPGRIVVTLKRVTEDECVLSVHDDGIGLPEGFDPATTASLGLQLVRALTEQIHGQLSFKTDRGTVWTITFPWSAD
jgi:two-component sensor histidine kinase